MAGEIRERQGFLAGKDTGKTEVSAVYGGDWVFWWVGYKKERVFWQVRYGRDKVFSSRKYRFFLGR